MSDNNRFFRWVWRFNALALALVALAGLGLLAFTFYVMEFRGVDDRPQGHFTPVPGAAEAKNTYRLRPAGTIVFLKQGGARELDLIFTLGNWEGSSNPYGLSDIKGSSRGRESYNANLLLVSSDTGAGHWLFPGFARHIVSRDAVTDPHPATATGDAPPSGPTVVYGNGIYGDLRDVKALIFNVIERDTNKDDFLGDGDRISLFVYHLGDAQPAKLLDADLVTMQTQVGADRYAVAYELGGAAMVAIYSVPDFKLLAKKPLPKVPN